MRKAGGAAALTAALCCAEVLTMAGTLTVPALVPTLAADWDLSPTEAGWLSGVYQLGYALAVPFLVALTDRVDARRVYLAGAALAALSLLGFALLAQGFWSALPWRVLGGVGLAGTYMPGLRILSDLVRGPRQGRCLSFYTASFAIGSSASVLLAGLAADALGWRWAFLLSAAATALALPVVLRLPAGPPPAPSAEALLDFRPVLRNRPAMGYVLAYAAHCWELFGFRSWLVAFLAAAAAFAEARPPGGPTPPGVATLATLILLLGLPASILGNEAATRWGRRRFLAVVMPLSAAVAVLAGLSPGLPFWAVAALAAAYAAVVNLDSASLTVGAVGSASEGRRGATMAVHSFLGFGAAFLGSVALGLLLDLGGGGAVPAAWALAFAAQGAVVALGPLALARGGRAPGGSGPPGRA